MSAITFLLATASLLPASALHGNPDNANPPHAPVEWVNSLKAAKERAAADGKGIIVYCWNEGSSYCTKLYQDTLTNADAKQAMGAYVCYSAKHGTEGAQELFANYGVKTLPTLLFLRPDGTADDLIQGFIPVADFVAELDRIGSGEGTVAGLEAKIKTCEATSTEGIEARWLLAGKVQALGNQDLHDKLMASIRKLDAKGKTLIGARLHMQDILQDIVGDDDGGNKGEESELMLQERMSKWDLAPLYAHAKRVKLTEAQHEAWYRIGTMEARRNQMQAASKAIRLAFKTCPEEQLVQWSTSVARWAANNPEERTSKEKKFALELANKALAHAQAQSKKGTASDEQGEKAQQEQRGQEAWCWNTVALCQHLNGRKDAAIKAAKRAVELKPDDRYVADLKRLQK